MFINLSRNVAIQNKLYMSLLNEVQQYELMQAGTISQLNVIDEASVPYASQQKPASKIIGIAGALGFLLSIAYIFLRQYLWKGIEDPDVVEARYNLPVIGSLHDSKLQLKQAQQLVKHQIKNLKLLSELDPHDLTVEGLRSLRTNLLFELPKRENNIITVSGPVPNIGKSFTAANLAQIMADANKKVLLVDADIRKGDLHHYFLAKRSPGLSELIRGKVDMEKAIYHTRVKGLDFLPTGQFPTKHAELLMNKRTKELLQALSKNYDMVIIDTAPLLAVTDAILLCKHAATKLMVLGYAKHDHKEIQLTIDRMKKGGVDLSGFIFNRVKVSHTYYGNKYKYKYKYEYRNK